MYHIYWRPGIVFKSIYVGEINKLDYLPKGMWHWDFSNGITLVGSTRKLDELFFSLVSMRIELRYLQDCDYDTSSEQDALETEIESATSLIREEVKRLLNV